MPATENGENSWQVFPLQLRLMSVSAISTIANPTTSQLRTSFEPQYRRTNRHRRRVYFERYYKPFLSSDAWSVQPACVPLLTVACWKHSSVSVIDSARTTVPHRIRDGDIWPMTR